MAKIADTAFIADGAKVVGNVEIGKNCGVWYNAVLRGDRDKIVLGAYSNVQDCAVLHVDYGKPCIVGEHVTIGHGAIVHACTVEDDALIGMGATVLHGARIGKGAMVAAGALVPMGREIPPYSLAVGVPARVVRMLTPEEIEHNEKNAAEYVAEAWEYRERQRKG